MKVQTRNSLESPLEYNQDQTPLMNQGSLCDFLTISGVTQLLCSFRLVLEGKKDKDVADSSRLEFLKVFSKEFCFIRCRRKHIRAVK